MARQLPLDIAALYARHGDELLVFLTRRTADAEIALDLWAETFAQAIESRRRFRGAPDDTDATAAWLYTIARRQLARYYRRGSTEQRAMKRLELERPPVEPEVLAELERRAGTHALRLALAEALAQLSPGVRVAIELRIVGEVPYAEIAEQLGIAEPAARRRVSRGLAALARLLDEPTIHEAVAT